MNKIVFVALILLIITSCSDNDPDIPQETELITTLIYTLVPNQGGDMVVFKFEDVDGDGGNDPIITAGILEANTLYSGSLVLLNESVSPTINLTDEINEEALNHQFFFNSSKSDLQIIYEDMDSGGNPVGLITSFASGNPGSGQLTITLRHEPNKFASGVVGGNIANAGGETDIEIVFDVNVQ